MGNLALRSAAFENGSVIPRRYGYKNGNHSPPLEISQIPAGTASLALIMDDPDAMGAVGKVWVHWVVWNIDPATTRIGEDSVPSGCLQGMTDFGNTGYGGPAPPDREHTYVFKLYALDSMLDPLVLGSRWSNFVIPSTKLLDSFPVPWMSARPSGYFKKRNNYEKFNFGYSQIHSWETLP